MVNGISGREQCLSPAVARVTHRLRHDHRVSNGRLPVQSKVREAVVQQLLLVGEVGDEAAIKLVAERRADSLHTSNVISYADLVRLSLRGTILSSVQCKVFTHAS